MNIQSEISESAAAAPVFSGNIMGNVLESDYSASETEGDVLQTSKNEVRSQGDGRESDGEIETPTNIPKSKHKTDLPKSVLKLPITNPIQLAQLNGYQQPQHHHRMVVESPKQLPPKGQLIPLKPVRLPEINSTTQNEYSLPINKQREAKFVPYEPYRGAVRSMTTDDSASAKRHSRRPSNSSSISGSSIGAGQTQTLASVGVSHISNSHQYNPASDTTLTTHYKNQTHSLTLMKERLKIGEKDIHDLQSENARLKKLMVDSMTGSVSFETTMNSSGEARGEESFDNLNDEIEVWRSKFLSSCILVDQLTKENRDMKIQVSSAAHLFREIKNTAGLTPVLYDQINFWLNRNALGINQLDYNYNNSSNDNEYNYNLAPHQSQIPSPRYP